MITHNEIMCPYWCWALKVNIWCDGILFWMEASSMKQCRKKHIDYFCHFEKLNKKLSSKISFTSWCGFSCHLIEGRLSRVKSLFESIHRLSTTVHRHCHRCLQTHTIKLRRLRNASKISNEHFKVRLTVKCVCHLIRKYITESKVV